MSSKGLASAYASTPTVVISGNGGQEGEISSRSHPSLAHEAGTVGVHVPSEQSSSPSHKSISPTGVNGSDSINETPTEKACWSTFLTMSGLISSFLMIMVYANWESSLGPIRINSFQYFMYCMVGGVFSGLPHTMLVPIDLIKCRVQVGEYASFSEGLQAIKAEARGSRHMLFVLLFRGWAPTFIGYSLQGSLKFGLYELFKHIYADMLFSPAFAQSWKVVIFLLASMTAELIADVSLAPWEAVKIKMQTTRHYPPFLRIVVPRMYAAEGMNAFFKGLSPLWMRQVPYTMMKFASFEKIVEILYFVLISTPKALTPKPVQLFVSVLAGLLAGALCAIVSHPADTVVSKLNQRADVRGGIVAFVAALGCQELWKGLGLRIVMIGLMTALQWLIYDAFKVSVGLPTTGSASPAASAIHTAMRIAEVTTQPGN